MEERSAELALHMNLGSHEFEVVITKSSKTVIVFNIEIREPVKSWTCKPTEVFTNGAVFDLDLNCYAAVVNGKAIRQWTLEMDKLDASKVYFNDDLFCLATSSQHKNVVVFANGCAKPLQTALEHPKDTRKGFLSADEIIQSCEVVHNNNEVQVLLLVWNQVMALYSLIFLNLMPDGTEERLVHTLQKGSEKIDACCFLADAQLSFLTLWSDQSSTVYRSNFHNGKRIVEKTDVEFLSWKMANEVCLIYLGNNQVAVMRCFLLETVISIWNLQFSVEKAISTISSVINSKVWSFAGCLLYFSEDELQVLAIKVESSSLSSVVGSSPKLDKTTNIVQARWSEKKFHRIEQHYMNDRFQQLPLDLQAEVDSMIRRGLSMSIACRYVITHLLESKNSDGLVLVLQIFSEIPEDLTVQILEYFVRELFFDNTLNDKTDKNNAEFHFSDKAASHLNLLLRLPFNDVFLVDHLRNLPLNILKGLLKYLRWCLDSDAHVRNGERPTSVQIFDWLCVILDSQFYNLTLSRDDEIQEILDNLISSVKSQFAFLDELEKIELLLNKLKVKSTSGRKFLPYSIEMLRIE